MNDIGVLVDDGEVIAVGGLGNDEQAGLAPDLRQHFQALFTHPLETVGRCPRLEGAGPEDQGAVLFDEPGDGECLLLTLHSAWPGHNHELATANPDTANSHYR